MTILESDDRASLRRFLEERFTLDELVTLAFDLGVNYQALPHTTTAQLSMAFVDYFERRNNLRYLLTEVLRQRHDPAMAQLFAKLPAGFLHPRVQIIVAQDIQVSPTEIIADLAAKLKIGVDQVELVSAAWGSLRLLLGLPQEAFDLLLRSSIRTLADGRCTVISITAFDSLDAASQKTWRLLAAHYPPWPPVPWNSSTQPGSGSTPLAWVKATLIAPDGKQYRIEIDKDASSKVLLAAIKRELSLPSQSDDGDPIKYELEFPGGRPLEDGSLIRIIRQQKPVTAPIAHRKAQSARMQTDSVQNRVFVVHGHDEEAKESVARYVEKLGLEAVILHERPNRGRTVIEKFEDYSDAAYAIVLLTPDDVGAGAHDKESLRPRARQNVILELGFFIGWLGHERVCTLHKGSVELPSDISGVIWIPLDPNGAWRVSLAKEMKAVGLQVDLNRLS